MSFIFFVGKCHALQESFLSELLRMMFLVACPVLQQWRLLPYVAAVYALDLFSKSFFMNFVEFQIGLLMKDSSDRQVNRCTSSCSHFIFIRCYAVNCKYLGYSISCHRFNIVCVYVHISVCTVFPKAELGREIHAMSCSSKPLGSWTAQRGIQECREACGGHGYLASESSPC